MRFAHSPESKDHIPVCTPTNQCRGSLYRSFKYVRTAWKLLEESVAAHACKGSFDCVAAGQGQAATPLSMTMGGCGIPPLRKESARMGPSALTGQQQVSRLAVASAPASLEMTSLNTSVESHACAQNAQGWAALRPPETLLDTPEQTAQPRTLRRKSGSCCGLNAVPGPAYDPSSALQPFPG